LEVGGGLAADCSTFLNLQRQTHGLQLMRDELMVPRDSRMTLNVADDVRYTADRHCQVGQVSRCCFVQGSRTPANTAYCDKRRGVSNRLDAKR